MPGPSAFVTLNTLPLELPLRSWCSRSPSAVPGTVSWKPNGTPSSRAVIRVNSLDDDPVWTPAPPPYWELTA